VAARCEAGDDVRRRRLHTAAALSRISGICRARGLSRSEAPLRRDRRAAADQRGAPRSHSRTEFVLCGGCRMPETELNRLLAAIDQPLRFALNRALEGDEIGGEDALLVAAARGFALGVVARAADEL